MHNTHLGPSSAPGFHKPPSESPTALIGPIAGIALFPLSRLLFLQRQHTVFASSFFGTRTFLLLIDILQRPSNSCLIDEGASFRSSLLSTTPSVRHRLTTFLAFCFLLLASPASAGLTQSKTKAQKHHKTQQRHKNITKLQDPASSRMSNVQPRVMSDKRQHFSRILFHNSWPVSWSFCFACSLRVELFLCLGSPQSYSLFFLAFNFIRSPRVELFWEFGVWSFDLFWFFSGAVVCSFGSSLVRWLILWSVFFFGFFRRHEVLVPSCF